ncbi:hypothetical protein AYO20_08204 [Fonsecaea nubica]|uniref:Carboxylesterase type B domain-containing protein n=1 Tax=Fonsecaea nubica TaxID=856822 RepID=A0A178CPS1_9EURO|nr:hypothetical protein AYO20_08204 [Fonsecaea nubica]OAL31294.1 hypothetical protein AYO20_08204 [Fonsecaea nubica]
MADDAQYPVVNTTTGPMKGFVDTHRLSVHSTVKEQTKGDRVPIRKWLGFGGNFNSGGSNFPVYDPTEFVRQQSESGSPTIIVTVNYRVGIFGFLSTDDLLEVNGFPGNFGLHDCIQALEWTQKNIASFGGDPENVTAIGESAGAFTISILLHSGRKLFQKAILQSGSHTVMSYRQKPYYPIYDKLLGLLGVDPSLPPKERVAGLNNVPMEALREAAGKVFIPDIWGITADPAEQGWKTSVWGQLERGEYDPWIQSILVTFNEDEGTFFSNRGKWWEGDTLKHVLKARGLLPSDEAYLQFRQLYGDDRLSEDKSNVKDLPATKFLLFNAASLWSYDDQTVDAKTAKTAGKYWSSFASSGDPGWGKCTFENGHAVKIGAGGKTTPFNVFKYHKAERDFFYPIVKALYTARDP